MFIDLVITTFDSVIMARTRKDSSLNLKIHHSFLLNKLPPLLLLVSESSLEPLSPEHCLSQAFHQLRWADSAEDSGLIDSSPQTLSMDRFRENFLLSCALHRVIPESSVVNIIGVSPSKRPQTHGLYSKSDLLNQLRTNHSGVERLVKEINTLDGNAGIVVDAVVEVTCSILDSVALLTFAPGDAQVLPEQGNAASQRTV
jgi:mediator of RNA polymerase II transcription subunit 5